MLAPKKWLNDYLEKKIDTAEFTDRMIMTGNAIEAVHELGADLTGVVAARIISREKHPDADKLQICMVDAGKDEPVQIVTGADNIETGDLIPVALSGAHLPNGITIKDSKLRGVPSYGMMCSGEELNITEDDYPGAGVYGILILHENAQPGTDIREVLGLSDTVFEFEVGANRPDCLSLMGIAREAAAAVGTRVLTPDMSYTAAGGDIADCITVDVRDTELCPRYMAAAVKNVRIEPSPKWMQQRLKSAGVRPINNIVDITNFVMIEMGQPMHAFDRRDIEGGRIVVRRAQPGEKMTTLDEKERELTTSMLMICDAGKPIGIAGVMGGLDSEIKSDTDTVIFEAAKFAYGNIRQTSRALGLSTESAMRFSKGVDAANTADALSRALHLVEQLHAGEIVGGVVDILSCDISPRTQVSSAARINALLGSDIDVKTMVDSLNRLELATTADGDTLTTVIPGLRADISGEADIAEEVARIYGYDNIPTKEMCGVLRSGTVQPAECLRDTVRDILVRTGFFECVTYPFGSPSVNDKMGIKADDNLMRTQVRIQNPLGEDRSVMRTSPIPDMLSVIATNLNHKASDNLRLFELGNVYIDRHLANTELPPQYPYLCVAVAGTDDFYALKAVLDNMFWVLNLKDVKYTAGGREWYHPGRKAQIYAEGEQIGAVGEISAEAAKNFGISGVRVIAAWLHFDTLQKHVDAARKFSPLPKFPAITRDLAFTVDTSVPAGDLADAIRAAGGRHLESVELFDVYTGTGMADGKKSVAYSLCFRAGDRTLSDTDIAGAIKKIIAAADADFGAQLRK